MKDSLLIEILEPKSCEDVTGCPGAGDYRTWARQQGYDYCEVFDWSSSAGDWTFIVSKDGHAWHVMTQTNNYPRPGFTRHIGEACYGGEPIEVMKAIAEDCL
jgi:hypothetical protein